MIQNLKNFIRHGKQARDRSPENQPPGQFYPTTAAEQGPLYSPPVSQAPPYQPPQPVPQAHVKQPGELSEVAARIVAEEREARSRLPRYPGLERFKLLDKMGEYVQYIVMLTGSGAFSTVYKAHNRDTGQLVAIKVVRKHELNASQNHLDNMKKKPKGIERGNILKEVSIMRQLNHPNIVSLIEFQESRDYYFLVLELCSGGELFHQIVRLTYFSEDLSRHVILQVAKGIRYLHEEKGVVHRDIKPENLLFDPIPFIPTRHPKPRAPEDEDKQDEGEFVPGIGSGGIGKIKIADFGLSKVVWDSQTMTPCGTVGYTAPEIVKDERYSKSVDMWALGCVLYTLLCGFPPFYDESIQTLTEKVARGQYTFLSPWWDSISKSAKDLISHLLTVDPVRRYTIDEFLHHPWIRESGEETTPAFDAPPTTLNFNKKEFIEPMDGVEATGLAAGGIPVHIRAAMQAGTTPLTPGARAAEFRSPGSVSLREVFDVSYAVHRMEEERNRGKGRGFGGLNALDEDEEEGLGAVAEVEESTDDGSSIDEPPTEKKKQSVWSHVGEEQLSAVQRDMQKTAITKDSHHHRHKQPANTRKAPAKRAAGGGFELNLEGATLLSRRGKAMDPNRGVGSNGAAKAAAKALKVES